jgi:tripartite-type tricarboxylate transporter receptor subunit TctC
MKPIIRFAIPILAAVLFASAPLVRAEFPEKPIHFISSNPAGGDPLMRVLGVELEKKWKQQVLVENRPGANMQIALEYVAKSEPDGYTLLGNGGTSIYLSHLFNKDMRVLPSRDLALVSMYAISTALIVTNAETARNLQEFIAAAKANPDKLNYGSFGRTATKLQFEWLKSLTGTRIREVPYKGLNEMLPALLRNELQLATMPGGMAKPHIDAGKLRPLFIMSDTRVPDFPDVPTFAEAGFPSFQALLWNCVLAPAKTPREILQKINRDIGEVVATPEFTQALMRAGAKPFFLPSAEIPGYVQKSVALWTKVAQDNNIVPE